MPTRYATAPPPDVGMFVIGARLHSVSATSTNAQVDNFEEKIFGILGRKFHGMCDTEEIHRPVNSVLRRALAALVDQIEN